MKKMRPILSFLAEGASFTLDIYIIDSYAGNIWVWRRHFIWYMFNRIFVSIKSIFKANDLIIMQKKRMNLWKQFDLIDKSCFTVLKMDKAMRTLNSNQELR